MCVRDRSRCVALILLHLYWCSCVRSCRLFSAHVQWVTSGWYNKETERESNFLGKLGN